MAAPRSRLADAARGSNPASARSWLRRASSPVGSAGESGRGASRPMAAGSFRPNLVAPSAGGSGDLLPAFGKGRFSLPPPLGGGRGGGTPVGPGRARAGRTRGGTLAPAEPSTKTE